jgi:hypothetical protein
MPSYYTGFAACFYVNMNWAKQGRLTSSHTLTVTIDPSDRAAAIRRTLLVPDFMTSVKVDMAVRASDL